MFLILLIILNIYPIENIIQTNQHIVTATPRYEEINYYPNYINKEAESAQKFLQLYNSYNPVLLLIDDIQQSQHDAAIFIKNLRKLTPRIENLNFIIMKFNSTNVTSVLASTSDNRYKFEKILNEKIPENPQNYLGFDNVTSAVFYGILNAVRILPPNSGIVIFMKREIEDEKLAQLAFIKVVEKRIQIFVIWSGKNDEPLLKEMAVKTHGAFLITSSSNLSEFYYERFLDKINTFRSTSLILSRKNLKGNCNLDFPIDSDVSGIHISITPNITQGILTTHTGIKIDVLSSDSITQFSLGSFLNIKNGIHEIHINTTTTTQDVGFWRLYTNNARTSYNITIFAHTKLTANAIITYQRLTDKKNKTKSEKIMKLEVKGDISSIKNITFVNENEKPVLNNIKFSQNWENYLTENIDNIETNNKEIKINIQEVPKEPFYAIITGKDSEGNDFRRLSYVRNDVQKEFYLPPITIELGLGSELITQPYRYPQIFFEVTNNGNSPSLIRFFCRDEKGLLYTMNPQYKWISPQETTTVRLTLAVRPGVYQDFINFIAVGSETVTKKVIVDIGYTKDDRRDPELNYHFTSDCTNYLIGSCEDGTWTVEVKAKDSGSGLLQVISIPKGLHFPNGFTSGTTEEVTGYFSESCCNPDLKLIAYDRQSNRRVKEINAYRAALSPGAIAAIVLGVLLLILIIIGIVVLIKKCCSDKGTGRYDLPVYRGPRRS